MTSMAGIPFTVSQDEDGAWNAEVRLWAGVGAVGHGETADKAVLNCASGLKLLLEHFAEMLPGEPGHVPSE